MPKNVKFRCIARFDWKNSTYTGEKRADRIDGKAVLQIRACRGMLQPDGTLRLLAYAGRRCLLSQAETGAASAGQNTTTKKRAAA